MKIFAWVIGLFLIGSAAAIGSPDSGQGDLGVIASSELNQAAAGIKECGLTTHVKQNWDFGSVKTSGNNVIFSNNTPEIIWFAQFTIRGSMKNDVARKYRIQWIPPNGGIFHDEEFKSSLWNETFIKKSIQFKTPIEKPYIGRWRVRVWKKDTLIDDRYFEIIRS